MIKNMLTYSVILSLCLILCGCPYYWNRDTMTLAWKLQSEPLGSDVENSKNTFNLKRLEKGMDREDVYTIMGMPDLYGQIQASDDVDMDIFYFYNAMRIDDGYATVGECIPLVMKNNKLVGWGRKALETFKNYNVLFTDQPF